VSWCLLRSHDETARCIARADRRAQPAAWRGGLPQCRCLDSTGHRPGHFPLVGPQRRQLPRAFAGARIRRQVRGLNDAPCPPFTSHGASITTDDERPRPPAQHTLLERGARRRRRRRWRRWRRRRRRQLWQRLAGRGRQWLSACRRRLRRTRSASRVGVGVSLTLVVPMANVRMATRSPGWLE
jgi:hypothetical protein